MLWAVVLSPILLPVVTTSGLLRRSAQSVSVGLTRHLPSSGIQERQTEPGAVSSSDIQECRFESAERGPSLRFVNRPVSTKETFTDMA